MRALGVLLIFLIAGCASSQPTADVKRDYQERWRQLEEWKEQALADCERSPEPAECSSRVRQKYNDLRLELIERLMTETDKAWWGK
jgi:hypothetical protein